ncbi:flagellin N-terminal helical domain-containing protein [Pseudoneobacillus sp. C159]
MRINHNIAALNTHRQLNTASTAQSKSMEKLASGLRINKAGDDAAGLSISEKMRGQIRGLDMAAKNAQDGISMIQTAEGALNETHDILQRMRELALQASNDTNTTDDRDEIQKEMNQLTSEISRIGNNTEFNTKKLLNGDVSSTGSNAKQQKYTISAADIQTVFGSESTASYKLKIGGEEYTITGKDDVAPGTTPTATLVSKTITIGTDSSAGTVDDIVAGLTLLASQDSNLAINNFKISKGGSGELVIEAKADGQFAGAAGKDSVIVTAGDASYLSSATSGADGTTGKAKMQIGANKDQFFDVEILDMRSLALKVSGSSSGGTHGVESDAKFTTTATTDNSGNAEYALDVKSATTASAAVKVIDNAIKSVSQERSKLGAYQNRLDHTINNLNTSSENLTAAESRIRDVDYALAA